VVKYGHQLEMPGSHNYADEPEVWMESEISMVCWDELAIGFCHLPDKSRKMSI